MPRAATLLGISALWIPLAFAFDGVTVLMLPALLAPAVGADHEATAVGLLSFGGLLAALVTQPLAGALSDRLRPAMGRRGFILAASVGVLIGLTLLGIGRNVLLIATGYVVLQVAAAAVQAAQQGFIPDLVGAAWRGRASGAKGLFDVGGAFLAFLVLGALVAAGQTGAAVAVIAAVLVVALAATLALVSERGSISRVADGDARSADATSAPAVLTRGYFFRLVAARFAFLLGIYAVGRFFVLLVEQRLGLAPNQAAGTAGLVLAALTLVTAGTALPAGWIADRVGRMPVMTAGSVVATVGILGLGAAASVPALLLFGSAMAVGSGAFAAGNWAMTADVVPRESAARFMGFANLGTGAAAAAAGLLGPVLDAAGLDAGFAFVLAVAAIATAVSVVPLRGLREHETLRLSPAHGSGAL